MVRWLPPPRSALADPKFSDSLAFYEALAGSLRDQHPDLQGKTIRILGVTMPATPEWDMSVRPFRRWHRVDFEVSDETWSGFRPAFGERGFSSVEGV
jgi:hypothetical protein